MTCNPYKTEIDGKEVDIIACGKGKIKIDTCKICYYPAEYLCDWPTGSGKTCDIKLCKTHSGNRGDNINFCPVHFSLAKKDIITSRQLLLIKKEAR